MAPKKQDPVHNTKFLSLVSKSRQEFLREYKKYDLDGKRSLYIKILREIEPSVAKGDLDLCKKLNNMIKHIGELEGDALKELLGNNTNPLEHTNQIILACKYKQTTILDHVLDIKKDCTDIFPQDIDESSHNAFYYAIQSNNTKLLGKLIDQWPPKYFSENEQVLDDLLSQTYEELKLKNVPLTDEMEFFVESKLINLRFYSEIEKKQKAVHVDIKTLRQRIDLVNENIRLLLTEYLDTEKLDEKFFFVAKFIAQNIHVLKKQMKSTYNKLPWEEIEFCLVCYIHSHTQQQEINLFTRATMNKNKLLNFLELFAKHLEKQKIVISKNTNIQGLTEIPFIKRETVIANIISACPDFQEFYNDYHALRDIHSLQKINDYIKLALSANPKEKEGQLVITRVLQVIGEYFKNTLESPKLSTVISERLLLSLPKNTRNVIKDLRNSLSHSYALSKRIEIMQSSNTDFFIGIQNDTKKIGDGISNILFASKMNTLRQLLKRVVESDTLLEIREVIVILGNAELDLSTPVNFISSDYEKLKKLSIELRECISGKTSYEEELFKQLDDLLKSCNGALSELATRLKFGKGFASLTAFQNIIDNHIVDANGIKYMKFHAKRILGDIASQIESSDFKKIASLTMKIFNSVRSRGQTGIIDEVTRMTWEIFHLAELGTDDIKLIQELRDTLSKNQPLVRFSNQRGPYKMIEDTENNLLFQKVSELKDVLIHNGLGDTLLKNIPTYKKNKKLQAAVEMLVLDIMSILGTSRNRLENNMFFLDNNTPLLTGKSLRNHLAHDNSLVNILLPDPAVAIILNAQKLYSENLVGIHKKLGQLIKDEPSRLREIYNSSMHTIIHQEKLFVALEEGSIQDLDKLLRNGADMNARSVDLGWTCLHFASKGSSLQCVKLALDNDLNLNVKDVNGQTSLHIAAKYGRADIVQLFIEKHGACPDMKDNKLRTPLHYAARNGHSEVVEILLKNKANFRILDQVGLGAIQYAISNRHIDTAKLLFTKGADIESMGGFTPLHQAADVGCSEITSFLLENGANVNSKNDNDYTPLHAAAFNGHQDVVNILITKGANVNAKVINGSSPLHYAVESGYAEITDILIDSGADVNVTDKTFGNTPLHYAAIEGYEYIIKTLLQNKANVDAVNVQGITPLHCAALHGHYNSTIMLLMMHPNRDAINIMGNTPLDVAVFHGHSNIVELLLSPLRQPSMSDWLLQKFKLRAHCSKLLHVAAISGNEKIVAMLINKEGDVNDEDYLGRTPLHSAALNGNKNVIDLLLKNKAHVEARSFTGETPLHVAATSGKADAVEILLNNNAKVDANASLGQPIHYALPEHKDVVLLLVKNGADVNALDPESKTPLLLAVQGDQKDIVQFLIGAGANVNVSVNGKSPLFVAVLNNNIEMVDLLIQNGAKIEKDLNNTYSELNNPIVFAISSGNKDLIKTLLALDINVNMTIDKNATLLHLAAQQGDKDIVYDLISKKAIIDAKTFDGTTPLCVAAQNGYSDVVELLITHGADVNGKISMRPLHLAVSKGHQDVVALLLEHGASVILLDKKQRTAVDIAVSSGDLESVKLLLKNQNIIKGIKLKNKDNDTLLHLASKGSNVDLIKFLMDQGYDINAMNNSGSKPIHIATREGFIEAVQFYITHGMDINESDIVNRTLLHYAAMTSKPKILKYLIEHGAFVNVKDDNGMTPLHVAAMYSTADVVTLLIQNNADYIAVDNSNRKPMDMAVNEKVVNILRSTEYLFQAVKNRNFSDVEKHIRSGALLDSKRSESGTVLHYAAWKGHDNIVKLLLENGANPNATCKNQITPLHYAAKFGHSKVVLTLLSKGAIYNALSDNGKTPADLSEDSKISSLFIIINDSFKKVIDGNHRLVQNINRVDNLDTVRAILGACNLKNESLIVAAIHSKYSNVEELKSVLQGDISTQIMEGAMIGNQGNYTKALDIFKSLYERRKRVLGLSNPGTLDIEEHIGRMYYGMGLLQEALDRVENVLDKRKHVLGVNSPETLRAGHLKALLYHRLEKNSEALSIFREVYEKQSAILGLDHSETIDTQFDMALVLDALQNHEEALEINRMVYEKRRNLSGQNSPNTIMAQNNIAMVLSNQGKLEEALKIYNIVLEKKNKVFGRSHLSTLKTLDNIPGVLFQQEKYDEALVKYLECSELKKTALGPYHPETLKCKCCIASVYFKQGKWVSAVKSIREVYDMARAIFGPNHTMILQLDSYLEVIKTALSYQETDIWEVVQHLQKDINIAAQEGDVEKVQSLLKKGADINDQDVEGRTLLHFAVTSRKLKIVKFLLDNGADVTLRTNKGNTTLHTAANTKSSEELIELLLNHVKNNQIKEFINAKTTGSGTTALHLATKNNSLGIVKSLLRRGAVYNMQNNQGKTPLELTADPKIQSILSLIEDMFSHSRNGNIELVRKLREVDPDTVSVVTNARNKDDKTILQLAIAKRHNNLVKKMLEIIKKVIESTRSIS